MSVLVFAFYLFAITAVAAGLMVVMARNPVHSVLWLILRLPLLGGAFRAGGGGVRRHAADHRLCRRGRGALPFRGDDAGCGFRRTEGRDGALHAARASDRRGDPPATRHRLRGLGDGRDGREPMRGAVAPDDMQNTAALGMLLYDKYILLFQLAGLILLVAMIGAIVLTPAAPQGRQAPERASTDVARSGQGDGTEGREAGAGAVMRRVVTASLIATLLKAEHARARIFLER